MSSETKEKLNCQPVQDLLSAYIDQELEAEEAAFVSAHLKECGLCQQEYLALKELHEAFFQLPELSLPEGFTASLHSRLLQEAGLEEQESSEVVVRLPQAKKQKFWQKSWFPRSIAAAIVLCACLGVAATMNQEKDSIQVAQEAAPMAASLEDSQPVAYAGGTTISPAEEEQQATTTDTPQQVEKTTSEPSKASSESLPARSENDTVVLASRWLQEPRLGSGSQQQETTAQKSTAETEKQTVATADTGGTRAATGIANTITITSSGLETTKAQLEQLLNGYGSAQALSCDAVGNEQGAESPVQDNAGENQAQDADTGEAKTTTVSIQYKISKQDLQAFLADLPDTLIVVSQVLQRDLADLAAEDMTTLEIVLQS